MSACQPPVATVPTETFEPLSDATLAASAPTPEPSATALPDNAIVITPDILLDPALAQDANSFKVTSSLYDGLVRMDASGKPQPALAESWLISGDQLDYIFTLRSDVVFSDGSPITPDVVIANFNRWFDPQNSLHQGDFASWQRVFLGFLGEKEVDGRPKSFFDGVEKVEQTLVLVHLNHSWPQLLENLADPAFAILKPDVLADGNYGKVGSAIISSGPYMVSAWTSQKLTLVPNPAYWGTPAQGELNFIWP